MPSLTASHIGRGLLLLARHFDEWTWLFRSLTPFAAADTQRTQRGDFQTHQPTDHRHPFHGIAKYGRIKRQAETLPARARQLNQTHCIPGKDGISDALLNSLGEAFNNRELVKVRIEKSCELERKEASTSLPNRQRRMWYRSWETRCYSTGPIPTNLRSTSLASAVSAALGGSILPLFGNIPSDPSISSVVVVEKSNTRCGSAPTMCCKPSTQSLNSTLRSQTSPSQ